MRHLPPSMSLLLVLAFAFSAIGCTSPGGFLQVESSDRLSEGMVINDTDIAETLELKPQLKAGFKLGIYIRPSAFERYDWNTETKEKLGEMCGFLEERGIISGCRLVNLFENPNEKSGFVKTLRLAGARHGVDAVLLLDFDSSHSTHPNPLALTYPLFITGFIVPGHFDNGICIGRAALWDVRNGFLYISLESEAILSRIYPLFLISARDTELRSRRQSENLLIADLKVRLQALMPSGLRWGGGLSLPSPDLFGHTYKSVRGSGGE